MRELFYDGPADGWLEGLPLGNGRLGAMVLAGHESLRLQLNDGRAWSGGPQSEGRHGLATSDECATALDAARAHLAAGRPHEAEQSLTVLQARYAQTFLPFADVVIRVPGQLTGSTSVERRLDLGEGIHRAVYGASPAGDPQVSHETFVSAPDGVLVHEVTAPVPVDVVVELSTPLRGLEVRRSDGWAGLELRLPADVAPGHEPDEPPVLWEVDGVTPLEGALAVAWAHDGMVEPGLGEQPTVTFRDVRRLTLTVATATTSTGLGRAPQGTAAHCLAVAVAQARRALEVTDLRSRHVAANRQLLGRVVLDLVPGPGALPDRGSIPTDRRIVEAHAAGGAIVADPDLVALLFDHARYLLSACSRPGGLPANLQGIWNDQMQPPWSSAWTLNINTEMNYWGALPTALDECLDPLLDLVDALADRGVATARRLYGARGWVAHHNTDAWAFTSPTSGDASWSQWPLGGVWLVRHLDELRRFGAADAHQLDRLWRLTLGAAAFALDLLLDDGSGGLVTCPSTSPENRYQTPAGPTSLTTASGMDRTLLTELLRSLVAQAEDLDRTDHPLVAGARDALARIGPPAVGKDGTVTEWAGDEVDVEPDHRHLSHLTFVYPGDGIADETLRRAVSTTLDRRGDDSTGWSLLWKICLRARLGQPGKVADLVRLVLRPADPPEQAAGHFSGGLYPNLFAAHPPFQIDGNLGFSAALAEALVQSHAGEIHLLPALPVELAEGCVRGLVARPGVVVDLTWAGGVATSATLTARSEEIARRFPVLRVRTGRHVRQIHLTTTPTTVEWPAEPGTTTDLQEMR